MNRIRLDVIAGFRALRRDAGSSIAIVGVLGAALALATTVFALGDRFVLRPLPYPHPGELVLVGLGRDVNRRPVGVKPRLPTLDEWMNRSDLFQGVGWLDALGAVQRIREGSTNIALRVARVSPEAMAVLGRRVPPCGSSGCLLMMPASVGRADMNGQALVQGEVLDTMDGARLEMAGVLPTAFALPRLQVDAVVVPFDRPSHDLSSVVLVARRPSYLSVEAIRTALENTLPPGSGYHARVTPLETVMTQVNRSTAIGALCAALLLLIVSVGSMANLLFTRAMARRQQLVTRRALGATAWDLTRLVAWEVGFMGCGAVILGLALARLVVASLARVAPVQYLTLGMPSVGAREVIFASLAGGGVMAVSSALVWLVLRRIPYQGLARAGAPNGRVGRLLRFFTIASQNGLAMIFIIGSVTLGRSYYNLFAQNIGVSPKTIVAEVSYPIGATTQALADETERTLGRLRSMPGVERVGLASGPLFVDMRTIECCVSVNGDVLDAQRRSVTTDFFAAVGAVMTAGRSLTASDTHVSSVVVTESFAKIAWPGENAIGRSLQIGSVPSHVVGIVRDIFTGSLDRPPSPTVYSLLEQPTPCANCDTPMTFVVKPSTGAGHVSDVVRAVVGTGTGAVTDVGTVEDRMMRSVAERVFVTMVAWLYASAATAICITGVIGVVASVMRRRVRELAIRSALGAGPARLVMTVAMETLAASAMGVGAGLFASRLLSVPLTHFVYGVDPASWPQGVVVAVATMIAIGVPIIGTAQRVLRISPALTLKEE